MVERLTEQVETLQEEASRARRQLADEGRYRRPRYREGRQEPGNRRPKQQSRTFDGECWRCHERGHIARNYTQSRASQTGKLETPGAQGRAPEDELSKAHSPNVCVCVSPVAPKGGYRLLGAVNAVQLSLLLDTRAAVTLLREDVWARIAAKKSQELKPRSTLKLVSAGGVPLTIHGCARVELELEEEKFATEIVVVSPLTTEAILGLDFLSQQGASIDLVDKKLHLAECSLSLREPESATVGTRRVRAEKTTEIPPCSMMEVIGCLDEPVEPGTAWLLEETTEKRAPTAVARALVQPMNTRVPVRLLNPRAEPLIILLRGAGARNSGRGRDPCGISDCR